MELVLNVFAGIGAVAGIVSVVIYLYAYARNKETWCTGCRTSIWVTWFYFLGVYGAKQFGGIVGVILASLLFVIFLLWLIRIFRLVAQTTKFKKWQDNFHEEEREG